MLLSFVAGPLQKVFQGKVFLARLLFLFSTFCCLMLLSAAHAGALSTNQTEMTCPSPEAGFRDGWPIATPKDVGLNCAVLMDAVKAINNQDYGLVHSLLVIRHGKLVFEKYWDGHLPPWEPTYEEGYAPISFDARTPHDMASITKSLTSTLFGIALEQGLIGSVHDPVSDYLPEDAIYQRPSVRAMKLRDLLTMKAGFAYDNSLYALNDPRNDLYKLYEAYELEDGDPLREVFSKPVIHAPGTVYEYGGNQTNTLALILEERSGMLLHEYAEEHLLGPLGIESTRWYVQPGGTVGSGDMFITPRDLAKVGYLYLNEGRWKKQQIVPEDWVTEALKDRLGNAPGFPTWALKYGLTGYGYQFWIGTSSVEGQADIKSAVMSGYGDQFAAIIPELDMIVIGTAGNWTRDKGFTPHPAVLKRKKYNKVIDDYILRAVEQK